MSKKPNVKKIINQIAKESGVTPQVVEADMKKTIREAMVSPNPTARAFWSELAPDGKEPSIEEFLTAVVANLKIDEESSEDLFDD